MPRLRPRPLRGSVMRRRPARENLPSRGLFYKLKLGFFVITAGIVMLGIMFAVLASSWREKQTKIFANYILAITQKAGFSVENIFVEGRNHTSKEELFAAINAKQGEPIFAFDPSAAIERIGNLPWVADAIIERRLPNTIFVRLSERTPLARWQNEGKTVVIDREGKELPGVEVENFSSLPLVVGEGAPKHTEELLSALKNYSEIVKNLKASVRVGNRRWNLYLQPNVLVRLPEDGTNEAIKRLETLIKDKKILDRNVEAIDLRFPGRFIIEPAAEPEKSQENKKEISRP